MMKPLLLVLAIVLANGALVSAAPAPPVRWEYAMVREHISRNVGSKSSPRYQSGAELRLQGQTSIFLPFPEVRDHSTALLDIFGRLGNKGWKLVSTPTHSGPRDYIFKRRK